MPSFAAAIIASLVGWILDALIEPFFGIGTRIIIGLIFSTYVYIYARNWLIRLRDGG